MLRENRTVPMWQFMLLFAVTAISSTLIYMPQAISARVGPSSWLAGLFSFPLFLALGFVIDGILKKHPHDNLSDAYTRLLGKIGGKTVLAAYFILVLFLIAIYLRFFCERIFAMLGTTAILPSILFVDIVLIYAVSRRPIVHAVRLCYICALIMMPLVAIIAFVNFFHIDFLNLLPFRAKDIWPLLRSSDMILGSWSYFTLTFLFRRSIIAKNPIWKSCLYVGIVLMVFDVFFFVLTIGTLGADLCAILPTPIFTVVKILDIPGLIERFDMLLCIMWIVLDFFMLVYFFYSAKVLLRDLFELDNTDSLVTPLTLFSFVMTLFIASNRPEIQAFSVRVVTLVQGALFFVVPFLVFGIGKLRKKI